MCSNKECILYATQLYLHIKIAPYLCYFEMTKQPEHVIIAQDY